MDEARRRLAWKPPFPKLSSLPSKMTVTALKRLWAEQDEESARLEAAFRIACTSPEEAAALRDMDRQPARDAAGIVWMAEQPGEPDAERDLVHDAVPGMDPGMDFDMNPDMHHGMDRDMDLDMDQLADAAADPDVVLPRFVLAARNDGIRTTGLRYGTIMHLVLQHLDPVSGAAPDLEAVIDGLCARGLLAEEERAVPNRRALRTFLRSDLYGRMMRAGEIHRETPFTVRMPASDILRDPSVPATETVVMQGIVDCWFIESGRVVLVDYKTDRGTERLPAYRRQLRWYAAALEMTVGMPVGETVLWFLHLGREIPVGNT